MPVVQRLALWKDPPEEWVPRLEMMRENAAEIHLVMNTNYQDHGIVNARLMGQLRGEGLRT